MLLHFVQDVKAAEAIILQTKNLFSDYLMPSILFVAFEYITLKVL